MIDLAGDMDVLRGTDPPLGIVNAFAVAQDEMDLLVDGFMLTEAAIEEHYWRTYQVVPGAGIGGVLGAYDSDAAEAVWHHYNDLGTLIATTDAAGETIHTAVPDFFGRPRYSVGASPSAMGLNSKFHFDQTDLNYSNARWLDTERGRWTSLEPYGFDGPNLYHFVWNDPVNMYDPNGLLALGFLSGLGFSHILPALADIPLSPLDAGLNLGIQVCTFTSKAAERVGEYNQETNSTLDELIGADSSTNIPPFGWRGGRRGNQRTRNQNQAIEHELEKRGYEIESGGTRKERLIPGPNGGSKGGAYGDVVGTKKGKKVLINTIDTLADGVTPTKSEATARAKIISLVGNTVKVLLVPKWRK